MKLPILRSGQDKTDIVQIRSDQVLPAEVRSNNVRSGQVKFRTAHFGSDHD